MPNELMPLHIFEERYRKMLKDVELQRNMFGLSFFDPQESLQERPEIGSVGCVGEVREVQALPDGRSNILLFGVIRYRIKEIIESIEPYLIAEIEYFEDFEEEEDLTGLQPLADDVFNLFKRIAKAAHKLSGQRSEFPEFPQAPPEQLSFLVAAAFNLDAELKYKFIEIRSTRERLEQIRDILDRSLNRVEESAKIAKISQTNGHTNKKINL